MCVGEGRLSSAGAPSDGIGQEQGVRSCAQTLHGARRSTTDSSFCSSSITRSVSWKIAPVETTCSIDREWSADRGSNAPSTPLQVRLRMMPL